MDVPMMQGETRPRLDMMFVMLAPLLAELTKRARIIARSFATLNLEANELLSELFLKLAQRDLISRIQSRLEQQLVAYCDETMVNICIDKKRKHDREQDILGRFGVMSPALSDDPLSTVMLTESFEWARTVLTNAESDVVGMRYRDGMSFDEIAHHIGRTPGAARGRHRRAIMKLRHAAGTFTPRS